MARLVFLSGEDSAECLFRAREAGADFFVEKPMNTDGLRYILQRVHHLWIGVMTEAGFPLARE
jgi:DNA-binding response OmpR family regulator